MLTQDVSSLEDDCFNDELVIDIEAIAAHSHLAEIKRKFDNSLYLYNVDIQAYFRIGNEIAELIANYFERSPLSVHQSLKELKKYIIPHELHQTAAEHSRRKKYFNTCMLKYHMHVATKQFISRTPACEQPLDVLEGIASAVVTTAFECFRAASSAQEPGKASPHISESRKDLSHSLR